MAGNDQDGGSTQPPRILFVDAYDSFSGNIAAMLESELKVRVDMTAIDKWEDGGLREQIDFYSAVVIGPGPGTPENANDVGVMNKLIEIAGDAHIPLLGICLGFQTLAMYYGGSMARLKEPRHGIVANIAHNGSSIFEGITDLNAVLYQSLHATSSDFLGGPDAATGSLKLLAWYDDEENGKVAMAVKHAELPLWGVQFHPESACSDTACHKLIQNWWNAAKESNTAQDRQLKRLQRWKMSRSIRPFEPEVPSHNSHSSKVRESWLKNNDAIQPKTVDYRSMDLGALTVDILLDIEEFQGANVLESRGVSGRHTIIVPVHSGSLLEYWGNSSYDVINKDDSGVERSRETRRIRANQTFSEVMTNLQQQRPCVGGDPSVPFWGGFLGFYSYEGALRKYHESQVPVVASPETLPCASFMSVQRSVVIDHQTKQIFVQTIKQPLDRVWLVNTHRRLREVERLYAPEPDPRPTNLQEPDDLDMLMTRPRSTSADVNFLHRQRRRLENIQRRLLNIYLSGSDINLPEETAYKENIARCQEQIRAGESYELCLTAEATIDTLNNPTIDASFLLYNVLRQRNPAPHAAFLQLGKATILSSSPERFLRWDRSGNCQMRPIKGTVKKEPGMTRGVAETILNCTKERAENLMIVDLIRHDLHTMVGSRPVNVTKLMTVEEYETVYQLVTVIETKLPSVTKSYRYLSGYKFESRNKVSGVEVLESCLPPGSMTGAPKKRSTEILKDIEGRNRGIYSGVIGYLDCGGGGDFAVVIRTAFKWDRNDGMDHWKVGAGGAITALSNPQSEWEEMQTKLESTLGIFLPVKTERDVFNDSDEEDDDGTQLLSVARYTKEWENGPKRSGFWFKTGKAISRASHPCAWFNKTSD